MLSDDYPAEYPGMLKRARAVVEDVVDNGGFENVTMFEFPHQVRCLSFQFGCGFMLSCRPWSLAVGNARQLEACRCRRTARHMLVNPVTAG